MGYANVPDDWGCYYTRCERCGSRYHESEGGCGCLDDHIECARHNKPTLVKGFGNYPSRMVRQECYVHCDDEQYELGGKIYCVEHAECDACGKAHDEQDPLIPCEGELYCAACDAEWED